MSQGLYIATSEQHSGKSIAVLGLMRAFLGRTPKVGYFRPIIDDFEEGEIDNHINTVKSRFNIDLEVEEMYGFTRSQVLEKYNQKKEGEIYDKVIQQYQALQERFDLVIVEGTDFSENNSIIEFDINVLICKNLGIPVLIVANASGKKVGEIAGNLRLAYDTFKVKDVEVLAVVANKVPEEKIKSVALKIEEIMPKYVQQVLIPDIKSLGNPTIREVAEELGGKVLFGEEF